MRAAEGRDKWAFDLTLETSHHLPANSINAAEPDPNFVGRDAAIADLNALVRQGAKFIFIQAGGGIGKTTLACKFLNQQGFDYILEHWMAKETQNITSVEAVIEEWLRRYFDEEPGREFGITLQRLRQKLRDRNQRIGILIDNFEPALDHTGKIIAPYRRYLELLRLLAEPGSQSLTLITSREPLHESSFSTQHYRLPSLNITAWQTFFHNHHIQLEQREFETALLRHSEAVEILAQIGAKCDLAEAYYQWGLTYQKIDEVEKSQENFARAILLWEQIGAPKQVEKVKKVMPRQLSAPELR